MECDLLIGADGIKSLLRSHVLGSSSADRPRPTGDAAYRAVIPASLLREHDDLRPLLETPEMTSWMGPRRHIMGYCIRNREEYNLVMVHPDSSKADSEEESWTLEGSAEKMREAFADFEPRIQKLLSFIPSTLKWKLVEREPLERWVDHSGRVVLMGDACHPMLPYRAQGAAMAVEDAAVLGNLLSRVESYKYVHSSNDALFDSHWCSCVSVRSIRSLKHISNFVIQGQLRRSLAVV
jgi:salicylate hydroxylase